MTKAVPVGARGSAQPVTSAEHRDMAMGPIPDQRFGRRFLLVFACLVGAFAVWRLYAVVVLAFASVLLALAVGTLAQVLTRVTRMPQAIAVALVVIGHLTGFGAVGWVFGSQLQAQFTLLAADLPQSLAMLLRDVQATPWGRWLVEQVREADFSGATGLIARRIGALFGSAFRILAYLAILMFAAVYLAAQPKRYSDSLLTLVPRNWRPRCAEFLGVTAATLRRWIAGQSITMVLVGTLSALGLWIVGVKAPLALGLIAGVFAFVPYIGPVMASLPGILMAATQGLLPAFYAAMVYGAVHLLESNLLTPLVQAEAVKLPPVLTIFAAVIFAILLGPVGVLLAAPITIVALVGINIFYVEDTLGELRVWPHGQA